MMGLVVRKCRASVAQSVEHRAVTREVVSSIPAGPTLRVFRRMRRMVRLSSLLG